MPERRRRFDQDFRDGAVRIVRDTGKSIAEVARDLGINEGTLGNWVNRDKSRRGESDELSESEREELQRLRKDDHAQVNLPRVARRVPGIVATPEVSRWP